MREIVLDTETTGFDPQAGDRIVEIGCLELINHLPTGKTFHVYLNPERKMPTSAFEVHGLGDDFLKDKPKFAQVVDEFLAFVGTDLMIIHNASFDMKFLNAELKWAGKPELPWAQALDTLELARKKFPGAQNSLDALCRRFAVDNSGRTLHGALLDSELLAEVYLELIGGRQRGMEFGTEQAAREKGEDNSTKIGKRPTSLPPRLTAEENAAHEAFVSTFKNPLWVELG